MTRVTMLGPKRISPTVPEIKRLIALAQAEALSIHGEDTMDHIAVVLASWLWHSQRGMSHGMLRLEPEVTPLPKVRGEAL